MAIDRPHTAHKHGGIEQRICLAETTDFEADDSDQNGGDEQAWGHGDVFDLTPPKPRGVDQRIGMVLVEF